jgi:hypothetical protein
MSSSPLDHTRLINRCPPAGSSVSPARERAGDSRATYAGEPDLLVKYPALASREVAWNARIAWTGKTRSPLLAA